MKYSITSLITLGAAALALAPSVVSAGTTKRASDPVVIPRPAIPDGSNYSRAPFPAARLQDDVTPPNGEAVDLDLPPNTPSTNIEPTPPPAVVAILTPQPGADADPGSLPTGRSVTAAAMSLDAANVDPMIRNAQYETREQLADNLRARLRQAEGAIAEFRRSQSTMSAEGRSQFKTLSSAANDREKALERSVRSALKASSAEWEQARAQLASDYQAYATAVAQIDAAAGVAPMR